MFHGMSNAHVRSVYKYSPNPQFHATPQYFHCVEISVSNWFTFVEVKMPWNEVNWNFPSLNSLNSSFTSTLIFQWDNSNDTLCEVSACIPNKIDVFFAHVCLSHSTSWLFEMQNIGFHQSFALCVCAHPSRKIIINSTYLLEAFFCFFLIHI